MHKEVTIMDGLPKCTVEYKPIKRKDMVSARKRWKDS
jgi:hypothetical protein